MSVDTLGHRAAQDLHAAASTVDVERSLEQALADRRRRTWQVTLLVAATAIAVVVAWLATTDLFAGEQSAPPADRAPRDVVGARLSVPVEVTVPTGWIAGRDAQAVELRPADGSNRSITLVGQPVLVYEPPDYQLRPLREDLVVWTRTRSDLKVSEPFGLDGPGFAWSGTEMILVLRPGLEEAPLVALTAAEGNHGGLSYRNDSLTITSADETFLWDVIYLTDSPPLLVASRSPDADDPVLKAARDELLQSLVVTTPPD